jgi:hypothetical protein
VKVAEEEKVAPRGGALYSCQMRWMRRWKRWAARRWGPLSKGGRRGLDAVGPWFGPGG